MSERWVDDRFSLNDRRSLSEDSRIDRLNRPGFVGDSMQWRACAAACSKASKNDSGSFRFLRTSKGGRYWRYVVGDGWVSPVPGIAFSIPLLKRIGGNGALQFAPDVCRIT
jgi:hypothetical protein